MSVHHHRAGALVDHFRMLLMERGKWPKNGRFPSDITKSPVRDDVLHWWTEPGELLLKCRACGAEYPRTPQAGHVQKGDHCPRCEKSRLEFKGGPELVMWDRVTGALLETTSHPEGMLTMHPSQPMEKSG